MRKLIAAFSLLILAFATTSFATGPNVSLTTTTLRESAITSNVAELTTFTLPSNASGVILTVSSTLGSLTNFKISPVAVVDVAGTYAFVNEAKTQTFTTGGGKTIVLAVDDFGGMSYAGISVIGTGTVTSSLVQVDYRVIYDRN